MSDHQTFEFPVVFEDGTLAWPEKHDHAWIEDKRKMLRDDLFARKFLLKDTSTFEWFLSKGKPLPPIHARMAEAIVRPGNVEIKAYPNSGKTWLLSQYVRWRLISNEGWHGHVFVENERLRMDFSDSVTTYFKELPAQDIRKFTSRVRIQSWHQPHTAMNSDELLIDGPILSQDIVDELMLDRSYRLVHIHRGDQS